jgi:hypothetical protein
MSYCPAVLTALGLSAILFAEAVSEGGGQKGRRRMPIIGCDTAFPNVHPPTPSFPAVQCSGSIRANLRGRWRCRFAVKKKTLSRHGFTVYFGP